MLPHMWVWWLHTRAVFWGPQRFTTGDKINCRPQVGLVVHNPCRLGGCPTLHCGLKLGGLVTKPLLFVVPPTLQSRGQNHYCPTNGPGGYITAVVFWGPQRFMARDEIISDPHVCLVAT